jgi:hypothetical protein
MENEPMITSEEISEKCEQLDPLQRETVSEFIDFLLSKHPSPRCDKKALLLRTSVWSDEDIQSIEEVWTER